MKKTKIIVCVILLVILIISCVVFFTVIKPYMDVKKEYEEIANSITIKNNELDSSIAELKSLVDSDKKPLDESLLDSSKEVIKQAEQNKKIIGEMPSSTKEIKDKIETLREPVDYSEELKNLSDAKEKLENSIKQYQNFINPTEEFIINRLANVDEIKLCKAVTEDNDPNGKLNKPGGYTATVYFESANVNQSNVYGADLIGKGTAAGGAIEVYANEEDAQKRETYLSAFDGGVLSSGSHRVIGTTLIRTSDELTATQQKNLEQKIIDAISVNE